jgi:anthranilate 1,2-dioxygenase small subunit
MPMMPPDARVLALRLAVEAFHADYCDVLDRGAVEDWPGFFTDDAVYRVIARNNVEAGRPLCLMLCDGMGMLKDRAYAIAHTEMYAPRYLRHHVSLLRVTGSDGALVRAEANYLVHETLLDEPTRLLQAGRYHDLFVEAGDRMLLKERTCVFDTVVVPNCVVFPV